MRKYVIIGSGSALYRRVRTITNCQHYAFREYRTYDLRTKEFFVARDEIAIVFSKIADDELHDVLEKSEGKVIIVGSCAAITNVYKRFSYSRLKRRQMDCVHERSKFDSNVTYVVFGDFSQTNRIGLSFSSNIETFWNACEFAAELGQPIVFAFRTIAHQCDRYSKLISTLDTMFSPAASLLLKYMSNRVYGYNDARKWSDKNWAGVPTYPG